MDAIVVSSSNEDYRDGSLADCIIVCDASGRIGDINPAGCKLLGQSLEQLKSTLIDDLFLSGGPKPDPSLRSQHKLATKAGLIIPVSVYCERLSTETLLYVLHPHQQFFSESTQDRYAGELKAVVQSLHHLGLGMIVHDGKQVLFYDQDWYSLRGFAEGIANGIEVLLSGVIDQDRSKVASFFAEQQQPKTGLWLVEFHGRGQHDAMMDLELASVCLPTSGTPLVVLNIRVITAHKTAEEENQRKLSQLESAFLERSSYNQKLEKQRAEEDKLAAMGLMASRLAHEINNPLAGIKNCYLLLKDAIRTDHPYYPFVGKIEQEIDRIAAILKRMYESYQPEKEEPTVSMIDEIIDNVMVLIEPDRLEKSLCVEIDKPDCSVSVVLPRASLIRALYNVIQNSMDASANQGMITVSLAATDDHIVIVISDQGMGIEEAHRSRIFEPFFTTKENNDNQKLGLGLNLAMGLIQSMCGELEFRSPPSLGTQFCIRLPRRLMIPKERADD